MEKNFWQTLVKPILALAPMVGITNASFRQLARQWGADVVYSEMISSEALIHEAPKAWHMTAHDASEYPLVVQLMGRDPAVMAEAAKRVEATGVSGIDINFGCPADKIAKNFCGVMLMRDLDRVRAIIEAVIGSIAIPVSIKVRTAISGARQSDSSHLPGVTLGDMLQRINDLPIAALMVHGRSFEAPFDGAIDTNAIKQAKQLFTSGPVLANGGFTNIENCPDLLQATHADGLGLARSVIGHPWLFQQIRQYCETGSYAEISWERIRETIIEHSERHYECFGPKRFQEIRRHLVYYIKGFPGASQLRQQLIHVNKPFEVQKIVTSI